MKERYTPGDCGAKRIRSNAKPEDIISAVASAFGTGRETIKGKGGRKSRVKNVAIYLIKRYSGLCNQEIGKFFGSMHYSAVSKSSARLEGEMAEDRSLRSFVKAIV